MYTVNIYYNEKRIVLIGYHTLTADNNTIINLDSVIRIQ